LLQPHLAPLDLAENLLQLSDRILEVLGRGLGLAGHGEIMGATCGGDKRGGLAGGGRPGSLSSMLTMTTPRSAIDSPYSLSPDQITRFREDGFIKLKNVMSPEALDYYGREITRLTLENNRFKETPLEQRGTYGKAFI